MAMTHFAKLKSRLTVQNIVNIWPRYKHKKVTPDVSEGICPKPPKEPSWGLFKSKPKKTKPKIKIEEKREDKEEPCVYRIPDTPDLDLSSFGGTPYKTDGSAYIIQYDLTPSIVPKGLTEDIILEKLERHPSVKGIVDPMPEFESVEQRLIDLCEKKLHPTYKRYLLLPKKQPLTQVKMQKIPPCVQNQQVDNMESLKEYMEKKNILWDFKRIEPPRCLTVTATEDINSEIAFEEIRSCLTKRCQTYKR